MGRELRLGDMSKFVFFLSDLRSMVYISLFCVWVKQANVGNV